MDVRERLMRIRIIEKMKEPGLKAYGTWLGIKDVSYLKNGENVNPCIEKKD